LNRWFDVYAFPVGEEEPRKVAILFKDITEQKITEEAIRKQSTLIDLSPDAIIVMDPKGNATFWSLGAQRLYGWTRSEVIGKQIHAILQTKFPEPIDSIMDKLKQTGFWSGEAIQCSKDGKEIVVQSRWSAKLDASGQIIEVLKSNVDITERKVMENEIRQTAEKLKQSNAELEQFAYVASHDLQEPLRMVASYVQLIERRYKGKLDSDADEFIGYAVDGANRMRGLIDDLLTYSRVSRLGKPFEPTDLESTFDIAEKNLQASIKENNAEVTHDKLPVIVGDSGQMVQLFQNLIGNAIKFHGKEPPRVHVSVKDQGGDYLFSIKDNGIGIDPQYFDRLFKIFQRLHTKQEYPGSGIGLVICKRIVERHGGRIWIESQLGKGSTIHFTLRKKQNE
jgi:PAS domain S-box-containing protein